jgi:hypothetical protein
MNQEIEQRDVIKLLFKEGYSGEESQTRLNIVYRLTAHAKRSVFLWMQRVQFGQTILVDAPSLYSEFFGVQNGCWSSNGWIQMNDSIVHTSPLSSYQTRSRTPSQRRHTSTESTEPPS